MTHFSRAFSRVILFNLMNYSKFKNVVFCFVKVRKKAEKEAEYQKFLKWKEEKLRKEMEQVINLLLFELLHLKILKSKCKLLRLLKKA